MCANVERTSFIEVNEILHKSFAILISCSMMLIVVHVLGNFLRNYIINFIL